MVRIWAAAAAACLMAVPAMAQTVDGTLDASYGAAKSTVVLNPGLASYAFSASNGAYSEAVGYDIYLTAGAGAVYGFLQTTTPGSIGAGSFANLYFDLDPANGNGSDLGFEITNGRAFVPGINGVYSAGTAASPLAGLSYAISGDGTGIEFSIDNSLFTAAIAGLAGHPLATTGSAVTLRLSQSFNYTVAGGSAYGNDRLGTVTLAAAGGVPEPSTWAMLLIGFGAAGYAMRRRQAGGRTTVRFA